MIRSDINNEYFSWLYDCVCGDMYPSTVSFKKLLRHLHEKEFRYLISNDENIAEHGIGLRHRYASDNLPMYIGDDILSIIDGPCSVLEMMVALAIDCEEHIMDDPEYGDRTRQWFWRMITNLGLGGVTDGRYDRYYVDDIVERFLDRDYEPDGQGGLFRIRGCDCDLRGVEIWHQLCWYLDSITDYYERSE